MATRKKATTKKITDEMVNEVKENGVQKLDEQVTQDTKIDETATLEPVEPTMPPKPIVEPECNIVAATNKIYRIYVEGQYSIGGLFPESKIGELCPEMGSFATIYEWMTYYGKPSRWEPVALYQKQFSGWELISARTRN